MLNCGTTANAAAGGAHTAVINACLQQLFPSDGSGCALLLRVVQSHPARDVAFSAFRIPRLILMMAGGWSPLLAGCADVTALEAVLHLGGGFIDPRMSPSCEMLWPLQFLMSVLASDHKVVATRLGGIPSFWPLMLAQLLKADNTVGHQHYADEQRAGRGVMARPQLELSVTSGAARLGALVLRHGAASAHPPRALAAPLLAALCDSLSQSMSDGAVAECISALCAARPEVVAESLKFDLTVEKLRQLSSIASSAAVATALRALAAPPDVAPLFAALMPANLRPAGVVPATMAQLSALDAEREKRERLAHNAAEVTTGVQDDAEAVASLLPLWRAAQAAKTGRARIALARASAMLRACELRRKRPESGIVNSRQSAAMGLHNVSLVGSSNPQGDFAFTLGRHHVLGGPELALLMDLPDLNPEMQSIIANRVMLQAGYAVTKLILGQGDEDERLVASKLCRHDLTLPDSEVGIFATVMDAGYPSPGLLRIDGALQLPDALCREVNAAMTWRFVPSGDAPRTYGGPSRAWCAPGSGAISGRVACMYYADNEGLPRVAVPLQVPLLVCSLAACFGKLPKTTAQKALRSMRAVSQGVSNERLYQHPPPQSAAWAGMTPAMAAFAAERAADQPSLSGDDRTVQMRSRMLLCGLLGCEGRTKLTHCAACRKIAYCRCVVRLLQVLDARSFSLSFTPALAAQPGASEGGLEAPQEECASLRDSAPPAPSPAPAAVAAAAADAAAAAVEDEATLMALSVRELRERAQSRGLDTRACIEKAYLVRLLTGARIRDAVEPTV